MKAARFLGQFLSDHKLDAELWCDGRSPWVRAVLLAYLIYGGVRHLLQPLYRSWFSGITLAFHELGHVIFVAFGETMHMLGGSLLQLAVPFAAALYLLIRQGDYFGLSVGGAWLGFSLWELAVYIADASRGDLPLVGFSDNPLHDWEFLLTRWHLLNHDATIAWIVWLLGLLVWLGSMALGGWLCWTMWRASQAAAGAGKVS